MEFLKTCKVLPIYNFNEIVKRDDLRYLVKVFDEFENDEFKLLGDEVVEARAIFKEIMYEYSAITKNRKILQSYLSQIAIEEQQFIYDISIKILDSFVEYNNPEVLEIFNRLKINFNINGNIEEQVKRIINKLKRIKTNIALMLIRHKERFDKHESKTIKEEVVDNLDEEAISLEIALKISYSIDTKKTSVSKWVNMWNVAGKINKPKVKN